MYTLKVVCCYCKEQIGVKECQKELSNGTTHGICDKCLPKVQLELKQVLAKLKGK